VAALSTRAAGRCYIFFACFDWILPFCNFLRRLGNLVAGLLGIRRSFFPMTLSPVRQGHSPDLPLGGGTEARGFCTASRIHVQGHCIRNPSRVSQSLERMPPDLQGGGRYEGQDDSRRSPWDAGAGPPG